MGAGDEMGKRRVPGSSKSPIREKEIEMTDPAHRSGGGERKKVVATGDCRGWEVVDFSFRHENFSS
jgi:hypothetical protein